MGGPSQEYDMRMPFDELEVDSSTANYAAFQQKTKINEVQKQIGAKKKV